MNIQDMKQVNKLLGAFVIVLLMLLTTGIVSEMLQRFLWLPDVFLLLSLVFFIVVYKLSERKIHKLEEQQKEIGVQ